MPRKSSKAGIYLIRHQPTGRVYVGQANDIQKRWREHKRHLNAGTHHNSGLQHLWHEGKACEFEFQCCSLAPSGLSPLQLQRWLVMQEREYVQQLTEEGSALNDAYPEIVATNEAVAEYQEEWRAEAEASDRRITAERREIRSKIKQLEVSLEPKQQQLVELKERQKRQYHVIWKASGWRRLFYSRPAGFDLAMEKQQLHSLQQRIDELSTRVGNDRHALQSLKDDYRGLYRQFSKVAARRSMSMLSYRFGSPGFPPLISE